MNLKLSILDQSPIAEGGTPKEALEATIKLAERADDFGYTRYWIAEHHDLAGLACPVPDTVLSIIGSKTSRIRIGAGAVLLPHYQAFNVAERYNLLATLFPGRVDLGIGRSPGGSAEASIALSGDFLQNVRETPKKLEELLLFLNGHFPKDNIFSKIKPTPIPEESPQVWLLGTSEKSGQLAQEMKLPYTFGHFMSDANGPEIVQNYLENMKKELQTDLPSPIVTVPVICAETAEAAEEIALSSQLWSILTDKGEGSEGIPTIEKAKNYPYTNTELKKIAKQKQKMIIGNPQQVKEQLEELARQYNLKEIMIITITHDYETRLRSYELIAQEMIND